MATQQADVQSIINTYVATKVIARIRASAVLAKMVNSDFDDKDIKENGDTIKVPKRGGLTVRSKTEGTPITSDSPTTATVDVVLNQHEYVSWAMGDLATSLASGDGIDHFTDAADALIESIESALLGGYANATLNHGTAMVPLTTAKLLGIKLLLDNARCPAAGRIALISNKDENNLLTEDKVVRADARGDGGAAFEEARVGRAAGFNVFATPLAPVVNVTPRKVAIAITYAAGTDYDVSVDTNIYTETADTDAATTLGALVTAINSGEGATIAAYVGGELVITTDAAVTATISAGSGTVDSVTVTPAVNETHGLAFAPGALALASRPLAVPKAATGVQTATITDTETGITLRYMQGYDITNMRMTHVLDVLYGTKLMDERKIVDITT